MVPILFYSFKRHYFKADLQDCEVGAERLTSLVLHQVSPLMNILHECESFVTISRCQVKPAPSLALFSAAQDSPLRRVFDFSRQCSVVFRVYRQVSLLLTLSSVGLSWLRVALLVLDLETQPVCSVLSAAPDSFILTALLLFRGF